MALINCPECGTQVSELAPTCPACGAPIAGDKESTGSGVQQLRTVQETSKKFKLQSLISATLFLVGMLIMGIGGSSETSSMSVIGGTMFFVGMTWYIVNRFRIWWHHK